MGASWAEWVREAGPVILITGASTVVMGTLPLLNGLFATRLGLDWQHLGWLGVAAQGGTLMGTLLGYWLIGRQLLRSGVQLGAICAVISWLFAATATTFGWLVAWRVLTSLGVGCIFSLGAYSIANMPFPARGFSLMAGVQVACGAAHAAVLPWLQSRFGYSTAVASIAVWFVLILILGSRFSSRPAIEGFSEEALNRRAANRYAGAGLLLSVMAFHMAGVTFWAYSERIAVVSGMASDDIAAAISIGNLGGIPASILGALAGDRVGYLPILMLATITAVGGEIAMAGVTTPNVYLFGQVVFNFGWMLGVSYYLALLAKRAGDPRWVQAAPIALVIAGALGPLWVALFKISDTPTALLSMSLLLSCAALIPAMLRRGT